MPATTGERNGMADLQVLQWLHGSQQSTDIQVRLSQLAPEVFQRQRHLFFTAKASLDTCSKCCPK